MSALVLDAGAFLAVERGERWANGLLAAAIRRGDELRTTGAVVAQVWRGGGRQALLARVLVSVDVVPVDETVGKAVGRLLGAAGASDVVDASVVLVAAEGDRIVTSDPEDIPRLVAAARRRVVVVEC